MNSTLRGVGRTQSAAWRDRISSRIVGALGSDGSTAPMIAAETPATINASRQRAAFAIGMPASRPPEVCGSTSSETRTSPRHRVVRDATQHREVVGRERALDAARRQFERAGQHGERVEREAGGHAGGVQHLAQMAGEAEAGDVGAGAGAVGAQDSGGVGVARGASGRAPPPASAPWSDRACCRRAGCRCRAAWSAPARRRAAGRISAGCATGWQGPSRRSRAPARRPRRCGRRPGRSRRPPAPKSAPCIMAARSRPILPPGA